MYNGAAIFEYRSEERHPKYKIGGVTQISKKITIFCLHLVLGSKCHIEFVMDFSQYKQPEIGLY
jgi:hypothetical protein